MEKTEIEQGVIIGDCKPAVYIARDADESLGVFRSQPSWAGSGWRSTDLFSRGLMIDPDLFPSIKPGQCYALNEIMYLTEFHRETGERHRRPVLGIDSGLGAVIQREFNQLSGEGV
jgi:hypothetical protein